jgi:hypothetical protein
VKKKENNTKQKKIKRKKTNNKTPLQMLGNNAPLLGGQSKIHTFNHHTHLLSFYDIQLPSIKLINL